MLVGADSTPPRFQRSRGGDHHGARALPPRGDREAASPRAQTGPGSSTWTGEDCLADHHLHHIRVNGMLPIWRVEVIAHAPTAYLHESRGDAFVIVNVIATGNREKYNVCFSVCICF